MRLSNQQVIDNKAVRLLKSKLPITVSLPSNNRLEHIEELRASVQDATVYMSSVWPGAINTAINAEKTRMESLDPRFNIKVSATESSTHFQCEPNEDVQVQLKIKMPQGAEEDTLNTAINSGKPIELKSGKLAIDGSELMAEVAKKATKLQIQTETPCELRFSSSSKRVAIDAITGKISGGRDDWRFEGDFGNKILQIGSVIEDRQGSQFVNVTVILDLARFEGVPVSKLPYFDQLFALYS